MRPKTNIMLYNPFNPNDLPLDNGNVPSDRTVAEACIPEDSYFSDNHQEQLDAKIQEQHDLYDAMKEQEVIENVDFNHDTPETMEGGIKC